MQFVAVAPLGELVVGRSAHDGCLQHGERLVVDRRTERARAVHVDVGTTDVGRGDLGGAVGPDHRADLRRIDVADQHGGALADEELDHRNTDRTETLHDDPFAAQRRRAGLLLDARPHRLQHPERGRRPDRARHRRLTRAG